MSRPLRVKPFTLTDDDVASEHVYASRLFDALTDRGITLVDEIENADVVHCFEVNFYTGAAVSAFRYPELIRHLRSETPVVVSTDDLYFSGDPSLTVHPRLYRLNHYTQRLLFEYSDAVIAISESVRSNLATHIDPEKLHVVRHGVEDQYRTDSTQDTDEPFVLHVSLAAPRKNPDVVREVARHLDDRFVIAGSGWDEYIPDTPEYQNVELAGYVPEDELVDLYHQAAVFYFPTLHEGFGLPVLEAMAANTAVATSDVYSVPEVAGDAAILHEPNDVDSHVDSIEKLLTNKDSRRRLAEAASNRAETFTWGDSAERTKQVYEQVLDEKG